jgi:hypothetical protein
MAIESSWIYPLKIVIFHGFFYMFTRPGMTELIKHILQSTKTSRDGSNIFFERVSFNSHRIHGAAIYVDIYGKMDPINIPPLC